MNQMGYDFVTLGNHDFNYGIEQLKRQLTELQATVSCVNVLDEQQNCLFPEQIKELPNGMKIGIVGITTEYIQIWEKAENLEGVNIVDPFVAAKAAYERIAPKVDVTICLYHGGFEVDLATKKTISETTENIGYRLATELSFDLLLTGHQHQQIPGQYIEGTYVVQPRNMGQDYFEIAITVNEAGCQIESTLNHPTGSIEQSVTLQLTNLNQEVQDYLDTPVGQLNQAIPKMNHLDVARYGNEWFSLIATVEQVATQADIAIVSSFNTIYPMARELTMRDILVNYPYENQLYLVKLTGKQLRQAMEKTATYFALKQDELVINPRWLSPKVEHYNYDFYFGLDYAFDCTKPEGERVIKLRLNNLEILDESVYSVAVNDYRANGGGEYRMYLDAVASENQGVDIQQLLVDHILEGKETPLLPLNLTISI
ncbi:bifunctional metallophosphatase/5'-nucleotidase [Vagococcus penaei]|nr:5'-nucleotidase C-terminal domain-containing protein [Vagococcus penaei]